MVVFLAGCISKEDPLLNEEAVEENEPIAVLFPSWQGLDHTNSTFTGEMWNQTSYVAYFSAPWCAHCESTINAYDQVIPAERMIVFSMESSEDYANMSDWHNRTETNLNRTIDRPFILNPELATDVGVKSIPTVVFINEQGYNYHLKVGKETNLTTIQGMWDITQQAFFDPVLGWNQTMP